MINTMKQKNQDTVMGFFRRYKKWFLALAIWQIIMISPLFITVGYVGYRVVSAIVNSADSRAHPFRSSITAGFKAGFKDGEKDHTFGGKNRISTAWGRYDVETDQLKKEYLLKKRPI